MTEKIEPRDISFETLMNNVRNGLVKIPDFQRDFVWNRRQIIDLLDSIYKHYPIGSFLFWITNEKLNVQRDIGNIKLPEAPEGATINYVLDGQQRITSLFASLEDAEIKIRENGKTRKKKIQIFFDLDNKEFVLSPDEQEEETLSKIKGWWPLPGGTRNYIDTLLKILEHIKNNNLTEKTLSDWIIQEYKTVRSRKTTAGYIDIVRKTGFVKIDGGIFKITELGEEVLISKDNKFILQTLIKNVDFFEHIMKILLDKEEASIKEIHEELETLFDMDWKSDAQVLWRLYWLLSLKYVEQSNKKYHLTEDGKNFAKSLKFDEESRKIEEDIRYVSVKKLIGYKSLELIRSIKSEERAKSFNDAVTALNSYKFSVIYVKDQPLDIVCNIFERINNSGTILNVVDLMAAKTWSESFNLKTKLFDFKKELKDYYFESIPDITILQSISANIQKLCNRKAILSLTREQFEDEWDKTTESIKKSIDFFYQKLNVCNSTIIPFPALLVPLSYFYYKNNCKDENEKQAEILTKWFWQASISNRFDSGVEGKIIEDIKKFEKILENKHTEFNYQLPILNIERIKNQNYSIRNAFCKTILCVYANKKPLNLKNNTIINLNKTFSKYNSKELHHIFPRKYLKKIDDELIDYTDSIVNIIFLPSLLNKEVSDKAPSVYLKSFNNSNLKNCFKSHLVNDITEAGLIEDKFDVFLDYRAAQILSELKRLTGVNLEATTQDKMIRPELAFTNRKYLWDTIRRCDEYIYWFDPYFTKNGFETLIEEVKADKIKKIRILSGVKQTNEKLRELYKKFKEEMESKGIKVEFRIIIDNYISNIHDRWILSKDICFNLPSINTIDRGQFSEIKITENRPPFEEWWNKSKDIILEWNDIKEKIKE